MDADRAGYITYDSDREELAGHTRAGATVWKEKKTFPVETHCTDTCPNAVFSTTHEMSPGVAGSRIVWRTGKATRKVTSLKDPNVNVYWSPAPGRWVGSTSKGMVSNLEGASRRKSFAKNSVNAQGRIAADRSMLTVSSRREGRAEKWSTLVLDLKHPSAEPREVPEKLPGPVGCISTERRSVITLGKNPGEYRMSDGSLVRRIPGFVSDCSTQDDDVVVGSYSLGAGGTIQRVRLLGLTSKDGSPVRSGRGEAQLGVFENCGIHVSAGRVHTFKGNSRSLATKVRAVDTLTLPDGTLYAATPTGKADVFRVENGPDSCLVEPA
ncbi:hypothetical protein [Streptomyces sp. NPDC051218]|uniref:hypothetical protein n=1 Tax=Streptomyces sp. NPDC051218 TaxID=3365645 RepID=UPI003790C960